LDRSTEAQIHAKNQLDALLGQSGVFPAFSVSRFLKTLGLLRYHGTGKISEGLLRQVGPNNDNKNASMQFCFTTALLMRWQVNPAHFVVFCNRSNFCHPSRSYATKGNNNNDNDNNNHIYIAL